MIGDMDLRLEVYPGFTWLDEQAVRDMLEVFCVADPGPVLVSIQGMGDTPSIRGMYVPSPRCIYLYGMAIEECYAKQLPIGGNITVAGSHKIAYACVLRHEIQHLNQHLLLGPSFKKGSSMFAGGYLGRGAEVDARRSVDESFDHINAMFGRVTPRDRTLDDRNAALMELLGTILGEPDACGEGITVSLMDLVDLLRMQGLNAPHNLIWMRESLTLSGAQIV